MTDFQMTNHGSLYTLQPCSDLARIFAETCIAGEETQYWGDSIAVEPRYAQDIAGQLLNEGFSVSLDGAELCLGEG